MTCFNRLCTRTTILTAFYLMSWSFTVSAKAVEPPRVLDEGWQIELIASEPGLVTPTGCCLDDDGNLLVIECHTHFPPENYKGPKQDRIYRFIDSDSDGSLETKTLFYEGGSATMNIANLGNGWIAIATRSAVMRIRDHDRDGIAEQVEKLLELKSKATYPHNGLGGLVLGKDGWLYVGQGENLGEQYELVASDGSKQVGGGEGGNIFRCRPDGSKLQRIATGFWNPFGLCFDSEGRLWTVGNDPDAMPPCRLLQVVKTGDYGFQFRFGRAGTHPLLAWNGELPGTLPMAAGTGEAPCAVTPHGNALWVTSWGDNRIERYTLNADNVHNQSGASLKSETEVIVQGDAHFRPVGIAVASDGSIYITDWVSRSYPVHGEGRLWRLSRKDKSIPIEETTSSKSQYEMDAIRLASDKNMKLPIRLKSLKSEDPFLRQAAVAGLVQFDQLPDVNLAKVKDPSQRVGLLTAWRWTELCDPTSVSMEQRDALISEAIGDPSENVVTTGLRWAAERGAKKHLPAIHELLQRETLSPAFFTRVVAAIAYLETGSASRKSRDPAIEKLLIQFAGNSTRPAKLRAMAIRGLPSETKEPYEKTLASWIADSRDRGFLFEIVRLLSARANKESLDLLAQIAQDDTYDVQTRSDALAGLSRNAGIYSRTLNQLSLPQQPEVLRTEARRILRRTWKDNVASRPTKNDLDAWMKLVGDRGDAKAGRRVFVRTTCINCHSHNGRGAKTGPDLTPLKGQMTRGRLLESILLPSKEVGPLYVPWKILTVDGRVLTGLKIDETGAGKRLRFQGADGDLFEVALEEIDQQQPIKQSIMPSGLEDAMTIEELQDLIAFLSG